MDKHLSVLALSKTNTDFNLYYLVDHSNLFILVLYVDNLILARNLKKLTEQHKGKVGKSAMKDMDLMHYIFDREVWQILGKSSLIQDKYIGEILKRFRMVDCKPITTLSQYLVHWVVTKNVLQYLKGNFGLRYVGEEVALESSPDSRRAIPSVVSVYNQV